MTLTYSPAGPTIEAFHQSNSRFRLLMGPIGSGKSTGCLAEILFRAFEQEPDENGIRYTNWAVVRNTFGDLERTTVASWEKLIEYFFPTSVGKPVRRVAGIEHNLRVKNADDGTMIHCDVTFLSLDGEGAIGKLMSMQLHGAFINECYLIDWTIVQELLSRIGRTAGFGNSAPMTWSGLWMDTNPPDDTNWVYKKVEDDRPPGLEVFKQPPAVIKVNGEWQINPDAENIQNHPKGERYWLDLIEDGLAEDWISVRMAMKYGFVKSGALIIDEYSEATHCPDQEFGVDTVIPKVYVGIDFGIWSSVAFTQQDKFGRWRCFDEETACDTNTASFAEAVVIPRCREIMAKYQAVGVSITFEQLFVFTGDPAGNQRQRGNPGAQTDFAILQDYGINASPAYTNVFETRREALNRACRSFTKGEPRFRLSRSCKTLRRALNSRYVFQKVGVKHDEGTV